MQTKFFIACLVAAFLAGCTPSGNPFHLGGCTDDPEPTPEQEMKILYADILALTQNMSCSDSSVCKTIAVGAKPCGGPAGYLIYNGVGVNEAVLVSKIKQYNAWNEKYNQKKNLSSDCQVLDPPKIDCVDGKCQEVSY
jgi:hypothetical protein